MEAYIGSIYAFGFNFAPAGGWALCNGQLLQISQYEALYTLIGTTYGGNGTTNFAVPNLQGRVPIGTGHGAGLQNYVLGQSAGSETVTLTISNMPVHTHSGSATVQVGGRAVQTSPVGGYFGIADGQNGTPYETTGPAKMAVSNATSNNFPGNSLPVSVMDPYQVVNYCICTQGIFPTHP